jgi:hypothetical protein
MKLFRVPEGTKAYLLASDGTMPTLRPWTVRKEMIFEREDLAHDPVTQANGTDFLGPKTIGHDLVDRGYSLFNPPQDCPKGWYGTGQYRKPKYVLVVAFGAVEVL